MNWGFPRYAAEGRRHGDAPTHLSLVANMSNPIWDRVVADPRYRCLIVLTHFANPAGEAGSKTRTWFSVADSPIVAWGGFCRDTKEFGPVYAGLTPEANAAVRPNNDRMLVLPDTHEHSSWLHGSAEDPMRFQFQPPIAEDRMRIEQTLERWRGGGLPTPTDEQMALL